MHVSLSLTLLIALSASVQAQSNAINIQDMTTPLHSIVFSPTVGATLKPGVVVDMSRPQFILKESSQLECTVDPIVPVSAVSVSVATREDKSTTYRQVALAVEASLSFFGAGKMELSNEEVNKLRQSSLYARLAVIDGVQSLGAKRPKWPGDWKLPAQGDPADRVKAFVSEYGTHYIHKLYSPEQARRDGAEHRIKDLVGKLADRFGLTEAERAEMLPSGQQFVDSNRVGWAKTYLKKAGLVEKPWLDAIRITKKGKRYFVNYRQSAKT